MTKHGIYIQYIALLLLFLGCNAQTRPDGMPTLYPLVLTVIQDGTPLAEARVSLFVETGESTWTVGGTTDASGKTSLLTHGKYPGVPAGKYKVCIFKVEGLMPEEYDLVDVKLKSPITTTLTLEATPGTKNITLDVGKPIRQRLNANGT